MRWLARAALAALGSMTSFFIACAYGVPWRYDKSGHVVDATTRQGIAGIRVACTAADVPGTPRIVQETRTGPSGEFHLGVDACDALDVADVDGAENGSYAGTTLPFTPADEYDLVVELDPIP
jgi:hypothetical protein